RRSGRRLAANAGEGLPEPYDRFALSARDQRAGQARRAPQDQVIAEPMVRQLGKRKLGAVLADRDLDVVVTESRHDDLVTFAVGIDEREDRRPIEMAQRADRARRAVQALEARFRGLSARLAAGGVVARIP